MKKIIFTCLLFLLSINLVAQSNFSSVTGAIYDEKGIAINGAIVSLLKYADSTLVRTAFTNDVGTYLFDYVKPGGYLLHAQMLGYLPITGNKFTIEDQPTLTLDTIRLQASQANLKQITVTGIAGFVTKKVDHVAVNPEALPTLAGSNMLEVLQASPGVQVDENGNISLRSKQGVLVYIDDKPTYLSSTELANLLKSMPASSTQQVQIYTNPPARYDAAGNAGIINIKLKRSNSKGFNGGISLSYGQGFYHRTNNSFNFNWRINKFNFFSLISYSEHNSYQDLTIKRTYADNMAVLQSYFIQNTLIRMHNGGSNAKLGCDYYINSKQTIGVTASGFKNFNDNHTSNEAELRNATEQIIGSLIAVNPLTRDFANLNINLNYEYNIDTLGKRFSANTDYLVYRSLTNQSLASYMYDANKTFTGYTNLVSTLPSDIDIKSFKADYVHSPWGRWQAQAGIKYSEVATENVANFSDEINGQLFPNYTFSNQFNYAEKIQAAYISGNNEAPRLTTQIGLRWERTAINGNQLGNAVKPDSAFTREYNSLFPTLFLQYKADTAGKHQLGLSYSRRIERPNYQDMNPFTYPLDRFTLYAGNPFLVPTISNNIELSHTFNNHTTTTLQYNNISNTINETIEQDTGIFYSRPGNIGKQISYGISINTSVQPAKWLGVQAYTEIIYNSFTANIYGQALLNRGTHWYIGPTLMFYINNLYTAEVSATYQTKVYSAQFVTIPVGAVRAGITRKIFKQKGNFKFAVSDIFYTMQPGGDIKGLKKSTAGWYSLLDTRVYTVAISYRFSKGSAPKARNIEGVEEKQRVK